MSTILVASFVCVCALMVISAALAGLYREHRRAQQEILAAEPVRPDWIYGRRMDIPGKYPALRTRNAKVIR